MKKLIEMVCAGNNGRSPLAELLAKNYIKNIGVNDNYEIISSGTKVEYNKKLFSGEIMPDSKRVTSIIAKGRERELYSIKELREIDEAIKKGDEKMLSEYAVNILRHFIDEERFYRNQFLKEQGIEGDLKSTQDQTIARPNTIAVFSMDKRNIEEIRRIYSEAGYFPKIEVLSRFATGEENAEVKNAFGAGKDVYYLVAQQLIREVPIALEKLLNQY